MAEHRSPNLMQRIPAIILILLTSSCFTNDIDFNKEYYERMTKIKLPEKYSVLESFDNGEFLTGAVFEMNSATLRNFIIHNQFNAANTYLDTYLMGAGYLIKNKPTFASKQHVYFIKKSEQNIHWTYIADLNSNRLWAEINYPDWGGR